MLLEMRRKPWTEGGILTVTVKGSTEGRTMEIKISDTGCGIPKST
jgi:signal transduction histidine kinase